MRQGAGRRFGLGAADLVGAPWAPDRSSGPRTTPHCLAGGVPILALDMYEHAYHLDFGAKAGAYVDAFMKNIHWERSCGRAMHAVLCPTGPLDEPDAVPTAPYAVAPQDLRDRLDRGDDLVVLDVCLAEDLAKRSDMLPGA